jgi:IS30 family transposase
MGTYHSLGWVQRRYWDLVAEGVLPGVAGAAVGVSEVCGREWFRQCGGVNPGLGEPEVKRGRV